MSFDDNVNITELYREIKALLKDDNDKEVNDFINRYLGEGIETGMESESYIKSMVFFIINSLQINLVEANLSFNNVFGDEKSIWEKLNDFNSIVNIKQWLYNIFSAVKIQMEYKKDSGNIALVNKIKEIIHNHYNEEISVSQIAQSIFFSARQANNIFQQEEGISIFEYLIKYRIDIAKDLLTNTPMHIYEVANKVGYTNIPHFRVLFQKYTGILPKEFRKQKGQISD